MAGTLIANDADVYYDHRKPIVATAVGVKPEGSASGLPTAACTWSAGAGVPAHAAPNGSMYTRTDATNGDDFLYGRVAGAWVPILGQTA